MIFSGITLSTAQDYNTMKEAFRSSYTWQESGEYTKAIKALKDVYSEDHYILNLRLGWLSYQNGSFTESMAYYQRAIGLKPYSLEPRFGITFPASALGNWNLVVNQYEKILEIDPQNTIAHYKLGLYYYNNEVYDKAFTHFEKIVNLYPFDYDGLIMYAWTNLKLGKLREAGVLFRQVLLYNPEDESAIEGLKWVQ
ncbi:MAG: tetratricopeptide repeat protein [Bacteroidetes bacterium]|nr:tetratricopeptide repeat protein [Bacteroidota bacterium]